MYILSNNLRVDISSLSHLTNKLTLDESNPLTIVGLGVN